LLWYYATHPLDPLDKTVANINLDGVNQCGRTRDVTVGGMGASDLDDVLRAADVSQGRTLSPDPESEKGFYYRSAAPRKTRNSCSWWGATSRTRPDSQSGDRATSSKPGEIR